MGESEVVECGVGSADCGIGESEVVDCGFVLCSALRTPHSAFNNLRLPHSALRTPHSEYSFTVASYDKSHDLIIDPLLASTFLGEEIESGIGCGIALDESGNVYVVGTTSSAKFPTTEGAYDDSYGGVRDVFISKLNSELTSLLASTFLGGEWADDGNAIAIDTSGNVFVAGFTVSPHFPMGAHGAFVAKLNSGLTSLLGAISLGAGPPYSMAIDTSGNVYVTGQITSSFTLLGTAGCYDNSQTGYVDAYVSKVNNELTDVLAATYLGASTDWDYGVQMGYSIAIDASRNVYVTGYTNSPDFPTTKGAYDTTFSSETAFVSKLDSGLTTLLASTFLGSWVHSFDICLAIDEGGNVYVTGFSSSDFPTTTGAYNTTGNGIFISKLNSGLTSLLASTFLSDHQVGFTFALAFDKSGNVYVVGHANSAEFPTTKGAYDITYNGGYSDAFVSKLNSGLTSLLASTFLGGKDWERGTSIALDESGNVYVVGLANSADFPTTSGAYDTSYNDGNNDTFVSKLDGNLSGDISCTLSLSPTSQSFGAGGGTGSVGITTLSSSCTWKAVSNAKWITVTSGRNGTGNGTVVYSVSANTGTSARTGTITIEEETFTVIEDGIVCGYSISPTSKTFTSSGGTGSVGVTASSSSCSWTAVSKAAWIKVTSGGNGTGNGTVAYSVSANTGATRTGTMTIAGETFTVTQDGTSSCTYSISPTGKSFTSSGGTGSVGVTASSSSCSWTAVSNAAWITVTSGGSGTGNGTVAYSVSANTGATRTGTITIAGKTFTVTQDGTSCTYSISPTRKSFSKSGGNGSVKVETSSGCSWTAVSNAAWITVTSGGSGTGNGTVAYSASANTGTARTGTMTIAGETFTVKQKRGK